MHYQIKNTISGKTVKNAISGKVITFDDRSAAIEHMRELAVLLRTYGKKPFRFVVESAA